MVGQIRFRPQDPTHTVVLGPFTSRGLIDSPAKLEQARASGSAARKAGQQLAWDTRTGKGRGRFMLAPAFANPQDAWNYYRAEDEGEEIKQLTSKMLLEGSWRTAAGAAELKDDLDQWVPGLWAERVKVEPGCVCGLTAQVICRNCSQPVERHCARHEPEAKAHDCRAAA